MLFAENAQLKQLFRKIFSVTAKLNSFYGAVRFANFEGILGFSVPSIILADLLGNTCLLERVK